MIELGKIYNEDCLETMKRMEDDCVDLVVTDPPYAIPTVLAQGRQSVRNAGDFSIVEYYFSNWFKELRRVLRPSGRMFVFCDPVSYPVVFRSSCDSFKTALLVWNKGRFGMGREFRKSFELILHCWGAETKIVSDGIGYSDILDFPPVPVALRLHPAQKPFDLVKHLLSRFPSTVIYDPFMGSGTTAIASEASKSSWLGSEINPEYCGIAEKRIKEFQAQGKLDFPQQKQA